MFKRKDVLIILWMTFITVVAWIVFSIYHIVVTSTISDELQTQITPIDPNFDMETINKLKTREKVVPLYQFNETNTATSAASPLSGADANAAEENPTTTPPLLQDSTGQAGQGAAGTVEVSITPSESTLPQVSGAP